MQVSHPPHLTSAWSSALIPFCAFKGNLRIGKNISLPGLDYPPCSSFKPTILEGQLCYRRTLNQTSGQGKTDQLMLLLDYNEDRSIQTSLHKKEKLEGSRRELKLGTAYKALRTMEAKVQIETLSPHIGFGGGKYKMTGVKRMSAKSDFLKMDSKVRGCEVDLYEDCRANRMLEECKCTPWELAMYQVGLDKNQGLSKFLTQARVWW